MIIVAAMFVHDAFLISPKPNTTPVAFTIEKGENVNVIDIHLANQHLISHSIFFKWFTELSHTQNKLQAGTFFLTPGTSIASMVFVLSNVQNAEVQITIPEGFTNDQIKAKLVEVFPGFDTAAWDEQTKDLQGYLFPDTYRFSKSASVKDIVAKMRATLDRRLLEDTSGTFTELPDAKYLHDTLVMASLIEKEVQRPDDMEHVAGVFFHRISIGMPLQTDTSSFTFKNKGLPPTPINNPGMNAIMAVLHPLQTDDLFFISLPGQPAVFAKTFEEQIANQKKFLK